jgi:hypothetical protein
MSSPLSDICARPVRWIVRIAERYGLVANWIGALATALLAVFAIAAWVESRHTTRILQNQLNAIRDSSALANRGWVATPYLLLTAPIENAGPADIQLRLENTGHSPARDVVYKFNEFTVPYIVDRGGYADQGPRQPNVTREGLAPRQHEGFVLWPGAGNYWIPYRFDDTEHNRQDASDAAARRRTLVVEGCLAYTTADVVRTTRFRFFLRDAPGASVRASNIPAQGCEIVALGQYECRWRFNVTLTGNDAN